MKNRLLIILLFLFSIISIITIYSSTSILPSYYKNIYIKQLIWYIIGFILLFIIYKQKKGFFYKIDKPLYIITNILLVIVLIFGEKTNGSKAWFVIPGIGSFQPSEFMKIVLIIIISNAIIKLKKRHFKENLLCIIKCIILTLIPSILTFLEPDTGNVIIYIIILISIILIHGINYKYLLIFSIILILTTTSIFLLIKYDKLNLIDLFGKNIFYRLERIVDWKNGTGMQLENALASIGSTKENGYGIGNIPIYVPEAHTDFIMTVFISTFGYKLTVLFIILMIIFDILIISIGLKLNNKDKYIITGTISIIIFQQIQNIGMNIGLFPITGITLPFISYGGSSLITYIVLTGIILNMNKKEEFK